MTSTFSGKKILVVDDVESVREDLKAQYQSLGLVVVGAVTNGIEALDFLAKQQVDLVSLDIIMPEMDGIECFRRIKAQGLKVLPFFVSWLAADPKVADALKTEIPADLFQGKPVNQASLRERIAKVLADPQVGQVTELVPEAQTPSENTEDVAA
jgi:CheY-like chemotaxis protein